jgi:hypothetical protein
MDDGLDLDEWMDGWLVSGGLVLGRLLPLTTHRHTRQVNNGHGIR